MFSECWLEPARSRSWIPLSVTALCGVSGRPAPVSPLTLHVDGPVVLLGVLLMACSTRGRASVSFPVVVPFILTTCPELWGDKEQLLSIYLSLNLCSAWALEVFGVPLPVLGPCGRCNPGIVYFIRHLTAVGISSFLFGNTLTYFENISTITRRFLYP